MAIGDIDDMARRMRATMPVGWFADDAPVITVLLRALGTAWTAAYNLVQYSISQSRIASASGPFLDLVAQDFYGPRFTRRPNENDLLYRNRICTQLLLPRGTRAALSNALLLVTGRAPNIFEPALPADTGGYAKGGVGYGVGGGWGNLNLPFQFFITVFRPSGGGIANLAGYSGGGIPVYGSLSMQQAGWSDTDLMQFTASLLPAASTAWTRIGS